MGEENIAEDRSGEYRKAIDGRRIQNIAEICDFDEKPSSTIQRRRLSFTIPFLSNGKSGLNDPNYHRTTKPCSFVSILANNHSPLGQSVSRFNRTKSTAANLIPGGIRSSTELGRADRAQCRSDDELRMERIIARMYERTQTIKSERTTTLSVPGTLRFLVFKTRENDATRNSSAKFIASLDSRFHYIIAIYSRRAAAGIVKKSSSRDPLARASHRAFAPKIYIDRFTVRAFSNDPYAPLPPAYFSPK